MTDRVMPRIQSVILPALRAGLPGVTVGSWVSNINIRQFPLVNVRRLGGLSRDMDRLDKPVVELTAFGSQGLVETEDLLLDARHIIWNMVDKQIVTPAGYLHSYFETYGPTQFDSPFEDTWRIQMLIQLGLRPPRT